MSALVAPCMSLSRSHNPTSGDGGGCRRAWFFFQGRGKSTSCLSEERPTPTRPEVDYAIEVNLDERHNLHTIVASSTRTLMTNLEEEEVGNNDGSEEESQEDCGLVLESVKDWETEEQFADPGNFQFGTVMMELAPDGESSTGPLPPQDLENHENHAEMCNETTTTTTVTTTMTTKTVESIESVIVVPRSEDNEDDRQKGRMDGSVSESEVDPTLLPPALRERLTNLLGRDTAQTIARNATTSAQNCRRGFGCRTLWSRQLSELSLHKTRSNLRGYHNSEDVVDEEEEDDDEEEEEAGAFLLARGPRVGRSSRRYGRGRARGRGQHDDVDGEFSLRNKRVASFTPTTLVTSSLSESSSSSSSSSSSTSPSSSSSTESKTPSSTSPSSTSGTESKTKRIKRGRQQHRGRQLRGDARAGGDFPYNI